MMYDILRGSVPPLGALCLVVSVVMAKSVGNFDTQHLLDTRVKSTCDRSGDP